jgi:membrane protease YdiL (CAAX protease family)
MPTDPLQLTLAVLEYALVFGGAGLVLWLLFNRAQRARWLGTHTLPQMSLSLTEFALGAALIFLTGVAFSALAQLLLGQLLSKAPEHDGLKLFVINVANYGGALVGWRVFFPYVLRTWQTGPDRPPARSTRQTLSWSEATGYGVGTLLVALPIIILLSLVWLEVLRACGLPDEPQDLIALFTQTKSAGVIAGMLLVACVFAPIYEELLFRAGLYRYVRQKMGRTPALLISGLCFGAMHANWAGLLPLAALGILLALVYEATGSIRVAIIAHGLFNLNTIILLLSGLTQSNP